MSLVILKLENKGNDLLKVKIFLEHNPAIKIENFGSVFRI